MTRGLDTTHAYIEFLRFVLNTYQTYLEPHMPFVRRFPIIRLMLHDPDQSQSMFHRSYSSMQADLL